MRRLLMVPAALALAAGAACSGTDREGRQTARAENTVTGGAYDSIYQREQRTGADRTAGRNAANAGSMGTSRDTVSSGTRAMQPSAPGGATTGTAGTAGAAGQALGAMEAADRLEIQTAQLALQRSQSAAVKKLAGSLLQDHRAHLQKVEQMAKQPGTTAIPPTAPTTEMTAAGDQLEQATGREFDLAFVQLQIDAHRRNIDALKGMHGQVQNARVDGLIAQTLPTLQHHLQQAETVKRQLGGSAAGDSTTRDSTQS